VGGNGGYSVGDMAIRNYSDETKAAVYGLRAKDSDLYFYVGCSRHDPQDRLVEHLSQAKGGYHANKHFTNKVKKIGSKNVVCDVLELVQPGEQFVAEKTWIEKLKTNGHNLVNRIHNEIEYEVADYRQPLAKEMVEQTYEFINRPTPRIKFPIPSIERLLQRLVEEEIKTLKALTDYLVEIGYVAND
jgi:hypothetical protein